MGFNLLKNQGKGIFKGLEGEEIQLYLNSLASFHASTHHMTQIEGGVKKIITNIQKIFLRLLKSY